MRKLRWLTAGLVFAVCLSGLLGGLTASAKTEMTADYLLDESNWINLPGYEYVAPDVKDEGGRKFPAELSFGENADGVGINLKMQGYYQSLSGDENGNEYAGIVLREKVSVADFSVTFTVNKLGASSSASPADDGWIGIGLMSKPNLWHTANTNVNSGAIALLRTSNRAVNAVVHEVAADGRGYKVANFGGSPTPPSANLDLAPATEGATLRYSVISRAEGAETSYFAKIEQLNFSTGEVISSKTSSLSLICPELYIDSDGMAYLAISCSTDNFEKSWDISIKNICGVEIGRAEDTAPVSAAQRAQNIYELIQQLKIYDYFGADGTMTAEGETFYVPGSDLDVNALATDLSVQLYNADAEVVSRLSALDPVSAMFSDADEYLAFLNLCKERIMENYEEKRADGLISSLGKAIDSLPPLNTVSLANERETYTGLQNVIDLYYALSEKAIEKLGAEYERIFEEVILAYEEKLEELSVEKYLSLAEELPESVTSDNAKETIFALVPAESIYKGIEDRIEEMEGADNALYQKLMAAKAKFDAARIAVDELKKENNRVIETYENGARVRNDIFYLPNPASAEQASAVFGVLVDYMDLTADIRGEITAEERTSLLTACENSLSSLIASLPEASAVTSANYLVNGYDLKINEANNYFNLLDQAEPSLAEGLEGREKLRTLVAKLAVLVNPLSPVLVEAKTVAAGEAVTLSFGDMFNNYFGLAYDVGVNYGTVDKALESFTVSFDEAGEYSVEVTMTDSVYGQTAVCRFTVRVTGGAGRGGCGSAVSSAVLAGMMLLAGGIFVGCKRKR